MSRRVDIDAAELLALIRHLDLGAESSGEMDAAGIEYLVVTRWNGPESGGHEDERAIEVFRSLLRDKLGECRVEEIGAAVLADIDSRGGAR